MGNLDGRSDIRSWGSVQSGTHQRLDGQEGTYTLKGLKSSSVVVDEGSQLSATEYWELWCLRFNQETLAWDKDLHEWSEWKRELPTKLFVETWSRTCAKCNRTKTRDWIRHDLVKKFQLY